MKNKKVIFFNVLTLILTNSYASEICNPIPNEKLPQYIIGYGSLIQTKSKEATYANTGKNIPVKVKGYQRSWSAQAKAVGASTTYLGIIKNKKAEFNGVIFKLPSTAILEEYDKREYIYCRTEVKPPDIKMYTFESLPKGQFWIYTPLTEVLAEPSEKYPIVQSYVDIFISGCIEQEKTYQLKNYASDCITTTHHWSKHWINDRIYPRRPQQYQPQASTIDKLLAEKLNSIFQQIKME